MKNLTSTLLCSVAMVGFVGTQAQAGSASPAPWEGLHVGAGISGAVMTGENNTDFHTDEAMDTAGFSSSSSSEFDLSLAEDMWDSGAFGTIEAGYDWALENNWVAGVAVDYTFGTLEGGPANFEHCGNYFDNNEDLSSDGCASLTSDAEIKNSWTAIARVGKAIHPNFLVYGLGGVTRSKIEVNASGAICEDSLTCLETTDVIRRSWGRSDHDDGLTLGGGVEVWLTGAWSGKFEYRHTNYDAIGASFADTDCAGIGGDDCTGSTSFDSKVHSLRLVLSRKLDLSGAM